MLTIGDRFPSYSLEGVVATDGDFVEFTPETHAGRWRVIFFYPKDFTFVCPTEIVEFGRLVDDFGKREADLLGVSTDSVFVHLAWRKNHEGLRELPIPLLSDLSRGLSEALGVLDPVEKVAQRATFVVDPEGTIRYAAVHDASVGRNPHEVLRILDALQTGELCPANWNHGDATLQAG